MVQILQVDVGAEADVVRSRRPVAVEHELVLRVGAVVRLEAVGHSEALEAVDAQTGPTAVDEAVRLQSRNTKDAPAKVLVQPLLLDVRVDQGVPVVPVNEEVRGHDVRQRDRAGVGVAEARAGIGVRRV